MTSPSLLFWCTLLFLISITNSQTKQATVTTNNRANGINISYNNHSVNIYPNEWIVTFASQQSYDLKLSLSNSWGFHSSNPSQITLTLNGTNYNTNEGDVLLVFSVSDSQYFATVIRNENSAQLYKAYPKPSTSSSSTTLAYTNVTQMLTPSIPDRWHRIVNNTDWYNTQPIYRNGFGKTLEWPIKLSIHNDPIHNMVTYSHLNYTSPTQEQLYSVTYHDTFDGDQGLDIYI